MNIRISCLLLFFSSCHFMDERLFIENSSSRNVVVCATTDLSINLHFSKNHIVLKGMTINYYIPSNIYGSAWSDRLKNSVDKKLKLYILDLDSLNESNLKNNWAFNLPRGKIKDSLSLTEVELDSLNWKIELK